MNTLKPQENTQKNEPQKLDNSGESDQCPRVKSVSVDALIDDLFGLNWKAIKTLGVAFVRPAKLAQAAWSETWESRYTPSFRLWFTLIAILFFFQFFWAADDSALIGLYATQVEESGVELPDGVSILDASKYYARINFAILPFASAVCLFAMGLLYRAWGEAVPFVVRVRYIFAVVIPSTALALPVFWVLGVASHVQAGVFLILSWIIPLPVDAVVAYKGVFSKLTGFNRLWRSVAVSLALFLTMLVSAFVSGYLAGVWIGLRHGSQV